MGKPWNEEKKGGISKHTRNREDREGIGKDRNVHIEKRRKIQVK